MGSPLESVSRFAAMTDRSIWQAALSHDRFLISIALALVIGLAWLSLLNMSMTPAAMDMGSMDMSSMDMSSMDGMQMGDAAAPWTTAYAAMVFAMWAIMMVAMMLPSAAPMILLYARVAGQTPSEGSTLAPTIVFAGTYVAVWALFSLVATFVQWALSGAQLLSDTTMALGNARIGGALLVAAGLYQLTPLKRVCLENCRSPFSFLTAHWRTGYAGAIRLGLIHGAYCIGCCWLLMALLFFGGVMNLAWVAAVAVVVLIEKALPLGDRVGQLAGVVAILAGVGFLVA